MVEEAAYEADPEGSDYAAAVNAHLPPAVRVFNLQRVNKKFNARHKCLKRTYEYLLPAALLGLKMDGGAGDAAVVAALRKALATFEGNHPFHNFTARRSSYGDLEDKQRKGEGGGDHCYACTLAA